MRLQRLRYPNRWVRYRTSSDAELYRLDLANDQLHEIIINSGTCRETPTGSTPGNFTEGAGGKVYFTAYISTNKTQVYVWDPASPNTATQLTSYNTTSGLPTNHGDGFVLVNNRILFAAYTGYVYSGSPDYCDNTKPGYYVDNRELAMVNLSDNSVIVFEVNTGTYVSGGITYSYNSEPQSFFNINGVIYFQARTGGNNAVSYQLCRIDLNAASPSVTVLTSFTNVQS